MKILFIAAEAAPLVKVGGLADVIGSLPVALTGLGHEVRVVIPWYGSIENSSGRIDELGPIAVADGRRSRRAELAKTRLRGDILCYLIGSDEHFAGPGVYTDKDLERFLFFSRAVASLLPQLSWQPDIIHCHDWHSALLPGLLRRASQSYATVLTIHNLAYQGWFDEEFQRKAGLRSLWSGFPRNTPPVPLSFMGLGIIKAGRLTTVSQTYAREIQTPEYGSGLDGLLRYRADDLMGIINGLDSLEYDPAHDGFIAATYDAGNLAERFRNKTALQDRLGLKRDTATPVIALVQRLDEQKGMDILGPAISVFMKEDVQLVILGRGRPQYEELVEKVEANYPGRAVAIIGFDNALAHLAYAGSDIFLMPSRFEPCGLGQLIAMRYGSVPVVRRTGGLAETVTDVTGDLSAGSGFVFDEYSPEALAAAVKRALAAYRSSPDAWRGLVRRIMKLDFSWQNSARKYAAVYRRALGGNRRGTR